MQRNILIARPVAIIEAMLTTALRMEALLSNSSSTLLRPSQLD